MKIQITKEEVLIIQMALSQLTDDIEAVSKDVTMPLTPEARNMNKEMLAAAKSAHSKIAQASGEMITLDPYNEGDEKEFLTKES